MTRWLSLGLVLAALLAPAAARADGDPASDYLYTQSLFLPLEATTPKPSEQQLRALLADAKAKGYPVRAAVIATRADLGAVPSLFEKPERYAPFLGQELRFLFKGPLLIVMPNGYGFYWLAHDTAAEQAALAKLPPPADAPDLARAAVPAIQTLAALAGVELATPPLEGSGHATRSRVLVAVAVVLVAALAAAGLLWRRRRANRSPAAGEPPLR
jgi:hypothetical protein